MDMRLYRFCDKAVRDVWMERWKLRGHVPFTNWNLVQKHMDGTAKTILDVGCGNGSPMRFLNRHGCFSTVGIDGFGLSLKQCKRVNSHSALVLGDVRSLPFRENSFDIVLCLQVLEHFDREGNQLLLAQIERIAKRRVIVTTDIGEHVQGPTTDGNLLQTHKYIWSVNELKQSGFRVFGMGLSGWGGETGVSRLLPTPLRWLFSTLLQLMVGPVMYFFPRYAGAALCVKDIEK